jgi:hypothetical protein
MAVGSASRRRSILSAALKAKVVSPVDLPLISSLLLNLNPLVANGGQADR